MRARARTHELLLRCNLAKEDFGDLLSRRFGVSVSTVKDDLNPTKPMNADRLGLYHWIAKELLEAERFQIRPRKRRGVKAKPGVPDRVKARLESGVELVSAVRYAEHRAGLAVLKYGRRPERVFERLTVYSLQRIKGQETAKTLRDSPLLAATDRVTRTMAESAFRWVEPPAVREALSAYLERVRAQALAVFPRIIDGLGEPPRLFFGDLGTRKRASMTSHERMMLVHRRRIEHAGLRAVLKDYDAMRHAAKNLVRDRKRTGERLSSGELSLLRMALGFGFGI
jgi:hypothetical protein